MSICHIIQINFLGSSRLGVPFSKLQNFSGIFLVLPIDYSLYEKNTRNFCLFVYLQSYNHKSKFLFLQAVQLSHDTSYIWTSHFCVKCWNCFLALMFLHTLKKNPVGKISKVLEMEIETHTLVNPKFIFENTKFKVLHYI